MKTLFLLHEQYQNFKDEPAYTEVVQPFLASGLVSVSRNYVYQRELREYRETYLARRLQTLQKLVQKKKVVIYGAGEFTRNLFGLLKEAFDIAAISDGNRALWHTDFNGVPVVPPEDITAHANVVIISAYASQNDMETYLQRRFGQDLKLYKMIDPQIWNASIHRPLEKNITTAVASFQPDLIVHALTFAGENLRGTFLKRLKKNFPNTKLYTQWWDYQEEIPALLSFEKDCLQYSDMVGIIDSHTRYLRIKKQSDIYRDYPCVEKLHWHPTVFDPSIYQKTELPKKYDVVILGSAEGGRKDYIRFLADTYGPRFHHFGGRCRGDSFISKAAYVRRLNQTRIFVNTQTHPHRIQLKGKVREAFACGTFVLEEDNPETRAFVGHMGGLDYFKGFGELRSKIDYYLAHPDEREQIAQKGYAWYGANYNAHRWTAHILNVLGCQ